MYSKETFEGEWWHPENPENRTGGVANFTPEEGVSLRLFSSIDSDSGLGQPEDIVEHDFLHGITSDGNQVTLKDCIRTNQTVNSRGTSSSEYHAAALLSGDHFADEISFNELRISYPLLTKWAGISGLEINQNHSQARWDVGDSVEVTYTQRSPIEAYLEDTRIRLQSEVNTNLEWGSHASIEEKTYLQVVPDTGAITYGKCIEKAKMYQDFLTIATGEEIHPVQIAGITQHEESDSKSQADIMFKQGGSYDPPSSFHTYNANFVLADIDEGLSDVLGRWVDLYNGIKPIVDLYTSTIYNDMAISDEMIAFYRATNVYYRRKVDDRHESDETTVFPPFNDIMSQIIEDQEEIFSNLRFDIGSSLDEIDAAINYFISYDESLYERGDMGRLFTLSIYMKMTVAALLLSEMGIGTEDIVEQLNRRYNAIN